jgi:hypothetical protein
VRVSALSCFFQARKRLLFSVKKKLDPHEWKEWNGTEGMKGIEEMEGMELKGMERKE